MYRLHEELKTLNIDKDRLNVELCSECGLKNRCEEEGCEGKLTVYCLEGMFTKNTSL